MSPSLDLNLLPILREAGKDLSELPGLYLAEPPRRTARGRNLDRLVLYLTLTGNAPLSPGKLDQVLAHLAQSYYKTAGSVTAALRSVAESLNQFLLDRNLRNASSGRQATGLLTILTLRGNQVFLAQSGPVHAFIVSSNQTRNLYEPSISGRGLGLSRTTYIRFSQAELQTNDTLVLACLPSPTWESLSLHRFHGQGLRTFRQRLVSPADLELNAVLIQARTGTGKFRLLPSQADQPEKPLAAPLGEEGSSAGFSQPETDTVPPFVAEPAEPADTAQPEAPVGVPPLVEIEAAVEDISPEVSQPTGAPEPEAAQATAAGEQPEKMPAEPARPPTQTAAVQKAAKPVAPQPVPLQVTQSQPASPQPAAPGTARPAAAPLSPAPEKRPARKSPSFAPLVAALVTIGRAFSNVWHSLGKGVRTLVGHMLPDETLFNLPAGMMAAIAIAVPVVVVSVATVIYLQRGLAMESQGLYEKAVTIAQAAQTQSDPAAQRLAWRTALDYSQQAQAYHRSPELDALQTQILTSLDQLDLVKRPNYQPAIIGGLPASAHVTRIVLGDDEIYVLDHQAGKALRATLTSSLDYELDQAFQCGPGLISGLTVGPLIDIAAIPQGTSSGATLYGLDATGNVIECAPQTPPSAYSLAQPLTAPNWGQLAGFAVDQDLGHVYVLDPVDKAVWAYWGASFAETPELYFSDVIPPLADVIDMTVDKKDLYLLHDDGHLTLCTYSGIQEVPTRCTDPMPYIDARPGSSGKNMTPETPFGKISATQPPDPSLYLLEPDKQGIFHFSLRTINFQRQFLPARSLGSGKATAFAVDQLQRIIYLAVGNTVYQASIP